MIRRAILGITLATLAACDRSPRSAQRPAATVPQAIDRAAPDFEALAASLAADRARLDTAHAACKAKTPDATPIYCEAAAEATRRRFRGHGDSYTPHAVDPFASKPAVPHGKPSAGGQGR